MSYLRVLLLALVMINGGAAFAEVTLNCTRPVAPEFDHAQTPTRDAAKASSARLQAFSKEFQAYVKCLRQEMFAERDKVLEIVEQFRAENRKFRKAIKN